MPPEWLWIPVTVAAAATQTLRNAAQRHLTPVLGTLGATLVRFLYGLPFALAFYGAVFATGAAPAPRPNAAFLAWVAIASIAQIAATACLLRVMAERNFSVGVAYSKTEIVQVAVFGLLFLGDPLTFATAIAVVLGTLGIMLLAPVDRARPLTGLVAGFGTRAARLGIASGAGFSLAAVGFRGAALTLPDTPFLLAAAYTLAAALVTQTCVLGGWLLWRQRAVVVSVLREWRRSLFAGFMGAAASACWFTAFTLQPAAHVRTVGLVEVFFGLAVSRHLFRERVTRLEAAGMALLAAAVGAISLTA